MQSSFPGRALAELCLEVVDCPHSTPKWTTNGVVVLRSKNIRNGRLDLAAQRGFTDEDHYKSRVKRAVPQGGDLVITREAPMGEVCILPNGLKCCLGQRMVLLRPDTEVVDGRYLLFALQSPQVQHEIRIHEGTGSTVSNLRIPALKALGIPLPQLGEQRRIARVLGVLDDKIELNRQMNQTLEGIAQAIFKSWFIDFDGVPPESLVDSELGMIPGGWTLDEVGKAVKVVGGGTPSTKNQEYWEGGSHCWTTPKDLSASESPVLLNTARRVTDAGLAKISSGLLPVGTFLLSSRAPVGYTAIARVPLAVNQGYIAVPPGGSLSPLYLLHWTRANLDVIKGRAGGTTFQEISKRNFRPIPLVIPPQEKLTLFEEAIAPLFDRIELNVREATTLQETRDSLLPKLISGQVRVPAKGRDAGGTQ